MSEFIEVNLDSWNDLCKERDRMKKALENAVDLITFEYCSHSEPHSATLTTCYAKEQLAALHYKETK